MRNANDFCITLAFLMYTGGDIISLSARRRRWLIIGDIAWSAPYVVQTWCGEMSLRDSGRLIHACAGAVVALPMRATNTRVDVVNRRGSR